MAVAVTGLLVALSPRSGADIIRLQSGGVLRGTLTEDASKLDDVEPVRITLLSGAVVAIARPVIRNIEQRSLETEIYETKLRDLPDTLEAHWEMAQWCREAKLDEQRAVHLEQVLEFDPMHREAHYGLGHTFYEEKWMTRDEYEDVQRERGLVKFDGKWVHEGDLKSVATDAAAKKARTEWFTKVRTWFKWATGSHPQRAADGLANLRTIRDEHAIPALIQFLGKDERPDVRRQFVETLRQIGTESAVDPLATLALHDQVDTLRELALDAIPEDQHERAQIEFIRELRNASNLIVLRAAEALGRTGNDEAVMPLIRALVTTHTHRIRVPVEGYSFGSNGGFNRGSGLPPQIEAGIRLGLYQDVQVIPYPGTGARVATKVVPISLSHENPAVLIALRHLTKQDFGFNETRWERWWKVDRHQTKLAPDLP